MREPGNLHPPLGLRRRSCSRSRPRIWAERSVRVATRKALRSRKEQGLIVSPPPRRGAALQYGSSMGWYQAAPGNDPTPCFAHRVYTGRQIQPAHRTATPRDVPGSRLLPAHRAARLQSGSPPAFGPSTHGLFSTLRASFLILQRSGVFWVTRPRPRLRSHGALEVWIVRVLRPVRIASRDRGVGDTVRAEDLSVLKFVRHPNFSNPKPGKHVNSSILEPNASTFSELLVHSAPFSTL